MTGMNQLLGSAITALAGWPVTWGILKLVRLTVRVPDPSPSLAKTWHELTRRVDHAGIWIGFLERAISFLCFATGREEGIAVWLALKVASKWEAWSNITKVPEDVDHDIDVFHYAYCRRVWAAQANATFLIGTMANVLIGYVAAELAKRYLGA